MTRSLDKGAWRIEATKFDGIPQDSFTHTSLHLRFTDWRVPVVSFDSVGQRDADVKIIETVVSVQDSGRWVADVDIYRALTDTMTRYTQECRCGKLASGQPIAELSSINTWDQVLDCANGPVVVRCFDNWVARLAVVSVLYHHGMEKDRPIVVCPKDICWKCIQNPQTGSWLRDSIYVH
jgi:hypothetical protein